MLALLQEAINNVQPEDWSEVVNKTERDIMSDWDRDTHIDNIMESSLIISVTDSDDEFSDNSDAVTCDISAAINYHAEHVKQAHRWTVRLSLIQAKVATLGQYDPNNSRPDCKREHGRQVAAPHDKVEFCPTLWLCDVLFLKN
ncbi:hypothetical protein EVAR_59431_1 [Eumeta japonica]|uniref:Uncharacterized protein n=1 Tax=Eumeta variegata TaxID=151549 RepID=A0A4C1ZPT1_EUMVA|nr:hypothetical protein EVAR_59431_1 [Eumeta japonica]